MKTALRPALGLLAVLLPTLALAWPWSSPLDDDCPKEHSEAWCLLNLAGHSKNASDASMKMAEEVMASANPKTGAEGASINKVALVISGLDYAKMTTLPRGVSSGFSGTMWLLGALTDGPKAGERQQMFIILPESEVKNGDPLGTVESAYMEGIAKYLETDQAPVLKEVEHVATIGIRDIIRSYTIRGGRCGEVGCSVSSAFMYLKDGSSTKPKIYDQVPAWAGGQRIYVWDMAFPWVTALDNPKKALIGPEKYAELLSKMPAWLYFYQPAKVSLLANGQQVRLLAH